MKVQDPMSSQVNSTTDLEESKTYPIQMLSENYRRRQMTKLILQYQDHSNTKTRQ